MACECFKKYEKAVDENIKKKLVESIGEIEISGFENTHWSFSGGDNSPVAMNYRFRYYRKCKDGRNESRLTKADHLVTMNYCPFCGTKFEGEK
jgi:predicted phosphoadenosine phosphosulfate sulfurtransferase